jgi:hypothetical protein
MANSRHRLILYVRKRKEMIINLATPFWVGISSTVIGAAIIAVFKFVAVVVEKKAIEKKFLDLISELKSLQKSHKNDISRIKSANLESIKNIMKQNQESTAQLLAKYHRLVPPAKLAFLEEWDNKNKTSYSIFHMT